jgi:hypothetical protein
VDCPLRDDMRFGFTEYGGPPAPRTPDAAFQEGVTSDAYYGAACHHPSKKSGINGVTPFSYLPMFNIIRDFCPDMMHIIVNLFKHSIPLMSGLRRPTKSKKFKKPSESCDPAAMQHYHDELARMHKAEEASDMFTLTPADQERVDARLNDLSCCKKFVRKSHVPFNTTEGGKKQKAADW